MIDSIDELGKLASLLNIEKEEDRRQLEIHLSKASINEKKASGLTWYPLKINDKGYGVGAYPYLIVQRNPGDSLTHRFQTGSPISLFTTNDNEKQLSGTVQFVDGNKMKISFYKDELPDWIHDGGLGVNMTFDSRTYFEMEKALNSIINVEQGRLKELREILLGNKDARFKDEKIEGSAALNDSQNEAVERIVNAEDLAIVHGPPGTGKTTTLVQAIKLLCGKEEKVMVCAPSNAAVDLLTKKLAGEELRVLRIGNLSKIEEDNSSHTLEVRIKREKEYKTAGELKKRGIEMRRMAGQYKRKFGHAERQQRNALYKEARSLLDESRAIENYLVQKCLDNAQVICCTLIASSNGQLKDLNFNTLVIDEAGQGLEPATWVPIQKANKVVLAGDPLQLPPTVKSFEAEKLGLGKTLIEKGIERTKASTLLKVQYRMNNQIMNFSNQWFYQGQLSAFEDVEHHCIPEFPVIEFIDTAGCGFDEKIGEGTPSKTNPEEASILLKHFENCNYSKGYSIGIVSPYKEQIKELRSIFPVSNNISINTVDSFQGQERDIIYISLVRSNDSGEIGFLKDYRRMNVAMTRARKRLVIFGDSATIGQDKFYAAMLDYFEKHEAYRSAWEFIG